MTQVTSTAVCQRPSSRWWSINTHSKPQVLLWSKNALLGLELYNFGVEYPFGPYHFGSRLLFWDRMPFQAVNTLLGHEIPFKTKLSFRYEDVLSGQDSLAGLGRPFGPNIPFLGHECPIRPRIPLLYRKCLIRTIMPLFGMITIIKHSRNRRQKSSATGIAYSHSLFSPCALVLINQLKSVAKTICSVFHHGLLTGLENHGKVVNR